jgi:SAM-dependent methyltransferase
MSEVDRPDYWEDIYKRGDAGWDKGRPSPPIARMLAEGVLAPGQRIAVPGAGRGHEAILIAKAGHAVTAIDFAPSAVASMKEGAARAGVSLDVRQDDVFDLAKLGPFDAILEHTIFCAIDTGRRREYASVMRRALKDGGVFFGLFYAHKKPGGPPWSTNEAEIRSTYGDLFAIERLTVAADSFPERAGNELEFVFRAT